MPIAYSFSDQLLSEGAWRDLRIDESHRGLVVSGKAYGKRPQQWNNVSLDKLCVNLVLRGRGHYTDAKGRVYELSPGILFHRFPGVAHTTWFDPTPDFAELFVVFDAKTGSQLMKLGLIPPEPVINVGISPVVLEGYKHLVKQAKRPEYQLSSRAALLEAIGFLTGLYDRAQSNRVLGFWEKIIGDAHVLLDRNLDERIKAENIAAKLGVSYASFRKRFKQATGLSPNDYRVRRRLISAQYLLIGSSAKETARDLGYCDYFAFSTQFKNYLGVSPREFKSRMQHSKIVIAPLASPQYQRPHTKRRRR